MSVEVIVVSSDTSASPVSSNVQNGSTPNDVTKCQRKKSRSRLRFQSESQSVSKGKRIVQDNKVTGDCERAQEIVPVRWENIQCMTVIDRVPLQVHGKDI